ncbi:hypothetical protein LMG7974_01575 [Campylobacter majalis]|uniref:Uncharacterized protein n=1 Tax=Campylobacter majalis TaxID=2790656 RepID=A0ABM8Q9G8_9BACT|nr:hypothetical protein [Campylobacter majalis]CAD7289498.1 hypothetical protein LMG7974_01575 [Campylobacter majalis]
MSKWNFECEEGFNLDKSINEILNNSFSYQAREFIKDIYSWVDYNLNKQRNINNSR